MKSPTISVGISIIITVTGLGDQSFTQHLSPPIYTQKCDKLRWRKEVWHWARTARAWVECSDEKAKGMLAALEMLLFWSLPASRQKKLEKAVETVDIVLDPLDHAYPKNILSTIEHITSFVAKD